ncbi:hypothetical protein LY76DRAFT_259349 [Colletotrichum caudatum]|nr:hypothetical protein LY76DRAFT_259349 [Colletotrichum caudatum]
MFVYSTSRSRLVLTRHCTITLLVAYTGNSPPIVWALARVFALLSALLILLAQFDSPVLPGSSSPPFTGHQNKHPNLSFRHQRLSPSKHLSFLSTVRNLSLQVDPSSRNELPKQPSRLLSRCRLLTSQERHLDQRLSASRAALIQQNINCLATR